jgi:MoaA/NifB/PqqE/SkfB family radical SAM enzyme
MTENTFAYLDRLPPELHHIPWRTHPMDGKLLLFERDSGLNVLLEGEETAHLQRIAPRTLLIAVTNACNMTCEFCYRDRESASLWDYDSLLKLCQGADQWGVLEIAFGGGEPMLFPSWADFINELYDSTLLCVNFTTNGTLLTAEFLQQIAGKYGNIRLSLYDDNDYEQTIKLLVEQKARFGVNWMITPSELPGMEANFLHLLGIGVRDFLLIGYKGDDTSLRLSSADYQILDNLVNKLHNASKNIAQIKMDVCWGDSLPDVPRLFVEDDCNAGDDYLSITSDKQVKACSFMADGIAFASVADLREIWEKHRKSKIAEQVIGCARL